MAIPITCTGCSTTLDVPDEFAGKTIRCTGCKTKIEVPDALEVEEAPAKKAFGHGANAPKPSAPSKPQAAPKAETKAAPKPAAKAAVADEDEEEKASPKTKSGAGKGAVTKAAAAKAATKRRRDDDDDDDDDEDDRPRKPKKKNQGAGGAMIAVIAVGVIGVLAIAGGGIYLATSGDKKKGDSSASASSSTSTPAGDGKPVTGGPGGPGMTMTPGKPTGTTQAGTASNASALTEVPEPAPGMGMGTMPAPGGAGGNPFGGGNNPFGKLDKDSYGTPGPWAAFNGDGFTADFPGTPEVVDNNVAGPAGNMAMKFTILGKKNGAAQGVILLSLPADISQVPGAAAQTLNQMFAQMGGPGKAKIGTPRDVTQDGYPGKEAEITEGDDRGMIRAVVAKNRVYMFISGGKSAEQATTQRFMTSIKITYKGGDPVAVGPGPGMGGIPGVGTIPGPPPGMGGIAVPPGMGGIPVPGMGAGMGMGGNAGAGGVVAAEGPAGPGPRPPGMGGVGGSGEFTDGNMKAKLDPFFTAVFDTENKEVFTLEPRTVGTRMAGTLRRYSYPDFRDLGKLKIANVGFRSAIDAKNGLLYVAVATNPDAALVREATERASAVGSVAVFDLKAVRDGKGPDGKELTDLKSVGTFTLPPTKIHGMELSGDGKVLYVLTSSVTTKKATLHALDTATRKALESKPAIQLSDPVRDLVSAGDDRTLIVIEDMNPKTKGSQVSVYDTNAWGRPLRKLAMRDGPTLDVAPLSTGGMTVSVLPLNAPNGGAGGPVGPMGPMGPGPVGPGPGAVGAGPGGGGPGGGPGGGGGQSNVQFQHVLVDTEGGQRDVDLGAGSKAANGGYVEYDPTGKKLYVGTWQGAGLDVYEVTDATAAGGVKLKTSMRTAKREPLRGNFQVSPDGKYLLFQNGLVLDTDNLGGTVPQPPNAVPGTGAPGMGMPPAGPMPAGAGGAGMPPAVPMVAGAGTGMPMPMPAGAGGAGMPPMPPKPGAPAKPDGGK